MNIKQSDRIPGAVSSGTLNRAIESFKNEEFGEIRTVTIDNEPWFVAADVCRALEIGNPTMALSRLDEDEKDLISIEGISRGNNQANVVNEYGLYDLILGSRKPEAKAFKRWITHEVIPSIRKHGAYATPVTIDTILENQDFGIQLLKELKEEREARALAEEHEKAFAETIEGQEKIIEEQAETIEVMAPKSAYYDAVMNNPGTVTVTRIAQDYGMSAQSLNRRLKEKGIQYKRGKNWYVYSEYAEKGWVQSKTTLIQNLKATFSKADLRWTQKGRLGIYETLKADGILPLIERNDNAEEQLQFEMLNREEKGA